MEIKSLTRLGAKKTGTDRPLRVELAHNKSKGTVLRNINHLAASEEEYIRKVFINRDMTFFRATRGQEAETGAKGQARSSQRSRGYSQMDYPARKCDTTEGQQHGHDGGPRPSTTARREKKQEPGGTGDGRPPGDGQVGHLHNNTEDVRNLVCLYTNTDCLLNKHSELSTLVSLHHPDIIGMMEILTKIEIWTKKTWNGKLMGTNI